MNDRVVYWIPTTRGLDSGTTRELGNSAARIYRTAHLAKQMAEISGPGRKMR